MKNFLRFVVYGAGTCLGIHLMQRTIEVVRDPLERANVKRKIKYLFDKQDESH